MLRRCLLSVVVASCLIYPSMAQTSRPPKDDIDNLWTIPEALPLTEIPDALDAAIIEFERVHRLSRELHAEFAFSEFYLGRLKGRLTWVVRLEQGSGYLIDRYDADGNKADRYRVTGRIRNEEDSIRGRQLRFFVYNGPGWMTPLEDHIKADLPGCQVYYAAGVLDEEDNGIDYRLVADTYCDGEFVRSVYISDGGDDLVLESRGEAPTDYRMPIWIEEDERYLDDY